MTIQEIENMPDDQVIYLPIAVNHNLAIACSRIKPLLRLLFNHMATTSSKTSNMHAYQLALMQEAEHAIAATSARWQGSATFGKQLQQLINYTTLPIVAVPLGLHATLHDYQHQGLNWLQFLRANNFSGVLADDMGLGKTIQTLANLQYEKQHGRLNQLSLIIAPTSLMNNWLIEAQRFTPELRVVVFHGFERHILDFANYDIVLTTYGLLQRDKERLLLNNFYYLILDEAQYIKNYRTKTRQIVQQIQAKHRLCLTGTPLENHLNELWSLFHFLMPGLLGPSKYFRTFFKIPIEKTNIIDRKELLRRRIQPFILRRTKNAVMQELPPKTEILQMVELTGVQQDVYETIRLSMENKVRLAISRHGVTKSRFIILDALLKLRQICCDPRLVRLPAAEIAYGQSAKLETLMSLLDNLIAEGRCVLIFSQFTSMLSIIEEQLHVRKYKYLLLTGKTKARHRVITQFQTGDVQIFLISLRAGGVGLNLTRAYTVILYDPWWNPAVQDQAIARSHRFGQAQSVFVYKLITAGTVEETILAMQQHKRTLIDDILSGEKLGQFNFTEAEILQFF